MLRRDLRREVVEHQRLRRHCGVLADDPYTRRAELYFDSTARATHRLDIEHIVALGNAWVTGARQLDTEQRAALANDPMNLLAVDAVANRRRATPTSRPGCRRTRRSGARTSPGRSG